MIRRLNTWDVAIYQCFLLMAKRGSRCLKRWSVLLTQHMRLIIKYIIIHILKDNRIRIKKRTEVDGI